MSHRIGRANSLGGLFVFMMRWSSGIMPLVAASSCRTLLNLHRLYMVFKTWLEISRKCVDDFFMLKFSRSIRSSIAFAECRLSKVVDNMERFLMNFSIVIWCNGVIRFRFFKTPRNG